MQQAIFNDVIWMIDKSKKNKSNDMEITLKFSGQYERYSLEKIIYYLYNDLSNSINILENNISRIFKYKNFDLLKKKTPSFREGMNISNIIFSIFKKVFHKDILNIKYAK